MIRDLENNLISLQNEANAHRLILGKSGYGKTWFCYRMLEESVEQKKNSLVFDYSGSFTENELEKGCFKNIDATYSFDTLGTGAKFLYFGEHFYSVMAEALIKILSIREYHQKVLLEKALHSLEKRDAEITISGIMQELEISVPLKGKDEERQRNCILSKLSGYSGIKLVFGRGADTEKSKYNYKSVIMQLSGYKDTERWFLTALLTELVWQEIKEGTYRVDYLVYDESQWMTLGAGSTLVEMLREGRKYGLGVWLLSQFLPTGDKDQYDTLLQANTIFLFHPSEKSRIEVAKIIGYSTWKEWIDVLSTLEIGEFVLKGHFTVNEGTKVWHTPIICRGI